MTCIKIIDYFFRAITFAIFASIVYYIHFEDEQVKEELAIQANIKNRENLPYLIETQDRLNNIGQAIGAKHIYMGSLRYASSNKDSWVYVGARIDITKCMDYWDLKKIILHSGFTNENPVQLRFSKAKRYQQVTTNQVGVYKELLCDSLYFDYSHHARK